MTLWYVTHTSNSASELVIALIPEGNLLFQKLNKSPTFFRKSGLRT